MLIAIDRAADRVDREHRPVRPARPAPALATVGPIETGTSTGASGDLILLDDQLVHGAQTGDRAAMDSLLRRHYGSIYAVCRQMTGNDGDAADAAQEALISIARGIGRFDRRSRFGTWVYRIAVNASVDELRRRPGARSSDCPTRPDPMPGRGRWTVGGPGHPEGPPTGPTSTPPCAACPRGTGRPWCFVTSATSSTPRSPTPSSSRSAPSGPASPGAGPSWPPSSPRRRTGHERSGHLDRLQLSDLLDGGSDPATMAHVRDCPQCAAGLESRRRSRRRLAVPPVPADDDREAAVSAALSAFDATRSVGATAAEAPTPGDGSVAAGGPLRAGGPVGTGGPLRAGGAAGTWWSAEGRRCGGPGRPALDRPTSAGRGGRRAPGRGRRRRRSHCAERAPFRWIGIVGPELDRGPFGDGRAGRPGVERRGVERAGDVGRRIGVERRRVAASPAPGRESGPEHSGRRGLAPGPAVTALGAIADPTALQRALRRLVATIPAARASSPSTSPSGAPVRLACAGTGAAVAGLPRDTVPELQATATYAGQPAQVFVFGPVSRGRCRRGRVDLSGPRRGRYLIVGGNRDRVGWRPTDMLTTNRSIILGAASVATAALLAGCGGSAPRSATGIGTTANRSGAATTVTGQLAAANRPALTVGSGGTSSSPGSVGTGVTPEPAQGATTITTVGTGTVTGTPDTVTVDLGVSASAAHASAALAGASAAINQLDATLAQAGVPAADIQTQSMSLNPNEGQGQSGYSASGDLEVTLHGLTTAGRLIDAAVAATGDAARLNGISLSIANSSPLIAAARTAAVADARTQAQQLAAAAHLHLGGLVSLSTQTSDGGADYPVATNGASGAAASAADQRRDPADPVPGHRRVERHLVARPGRPARVPVKSFVRPPAAG